MFDCYNSEEDKEVFTQSNEEQGVSWGEASPDPVKVENGEMLVSAKIVIIF